MRKTFTLMAMVMALALSALSPAAAVDAVVTANQDFACEAGVTYTTVQIVSSDVTIDGCTFDGGGTTANAIVNKVAGFSNVTITNSTFHGYNGRTITFGFSEGTSLAGEGNRASNVTISKNTLGDMTGNAATSIAVFNTDGVTITKNTISNANPAVTGRRGINLDGNSAVRVQNNVISMGASGQLGSPFPVFFAAPWAIQVSMSDAPAVDYSIINNSMSGSYDGISVLSQRDVTGLRIISNEIAAGFGVRVNAGVAPTDARTFSAIEMSGNRIDATAFQGFSNGIRLQGNHGITYRDVRITGNRAVGATQAVVVGQAATLDNVKIKGNK